MTAQTTTLLAIDQGTTSSRAIVFDRKGRKLGVAQQELPQSFPQSAAGVTGDPGSVVMVEHNPERIWKDTVATVRGALRKARTGAREIAALGITNQRETTIVWDRASGKPVYPAIVWQDRRTADFCRAQQSEKTERWLADKTGLLLDPYFSAT